MTIAHRFRRWAFAAIALLPLTVFLATCQPARTAAVSDPAASSEEPERLRPVDVKPASSCAATLLAVEIPSPEGSSTVTLRLDQLALIVADAATAERLGLVAASNQRWPNSKPLLLPQPQITSAADYAAAWRTLAAKPGVQRLLGVPGQDGEGYIGTRLVIGIAAGSDPTALVAGQGLEMVELRRRSALLEAPGRDALEILHLAAELAQMPELRWAEADRIGRHRLQAEPLIDQQWHLPLLNAAEAWALTDADDQPIRGHNVNISIVDSGVDATHLDLQPNLREDLGYDYADLDDDPDPEGDGHGTEVAGLAAAVGDNGIGGSGVAPQAGLIALRAITGTAYASATAGALAHGIEATAPADRVFVSNNSWVYDGAYIDWTRGEREAVEDGIALGRAGLGVIYVFAAGNDYEYGMAVDYRRPQNDLRTLAIGAIDADGDIASYSEEGASLTAVAPGGDVSGMVTTTLGPDEPHDTYSTELNGPSGTSYAAPNAAGVVALMLQANAELGWRDVQHILARSSTRIHPGHSSWSENAAGLRHSRIYGWGLIDAAAAVQKALTWQPVGAVATSSHNRTKLNTPIPDDDPEGITITFTLAAEPGHRCEQVELHLGITHSSLGDLEYELTSPQGTAVTIPHSAAITTSASSSFTWTFPYKGFWGENPNGIWTLRVSDMLPEDTGSLRHARLSAHTWQALQAPGLDAVVNQTTGLPFVLLGSTAQTLELSGSAFVEGDVVLWNDSELPTEVINDRTLHATTLPELHNEAEHSGFQQIRVSRSDELGSITSNALPLEVLQPQVIIVSRPDLSIEVGETWSYTVTAAADRLLPEAELELLVLDGTVDPLPTVDNLTLTWLADSIAEVEKGHAAFRLRLQDKDAPEKIWDEQRILLRLTGPAASGQLQSHAALPAFATEERP